MVVRALLIVSVILFMLVGHIDCLRQLNKELPHGLPPGYVGDGQAYKVAYYIVLALACLLFCTGMSLMKC